jgi:hypothetical protein
MSIPIVNADRKIVGWTEVIPEVFGAVLRHSDAERLVGGKIAAIYVEVLNTEDAEKAGAPANWKGVWRCLALCSERILQNPQFAQPIPTVRVETKR